MKYRFLLSIFVLSFSSCSKKVVSNPFDGIWNSIGHGQVLEISDNARYAYYDVTTISCLPARKGDIEDIASSLTLENDILVLDSGDIIYKFRRTSELPTLCNMSYVHKAEDPLFNFEVFMETIKEHYAFMDLNNINWDDLYRRQAEKITVNSTNAELYLTIEETYELLNDNHAFLIATDEVYDELDELPQLENETDDALPEYGDFPVAEMVANNMLLKEMTRNTGLIQWGLLSKDIGYLQVKSMWLFADLNLSNTLIDSIGFVDAFGEARDKMYVGDYMDKEVEGVSEVMDLVMKDLRDTKSIVIDVRFNGGGQEVVSFEILSRFISGRIQIGTHQFRYGNNHTPSSPIYLEGVEDSYDKPVYVLTSPQSGSAAESFSLSTMSMPNVIRIGSATEGALSTTLDKTLPNGWKFFLSNEIMMDNNGEFYENRGIPVHYELDYPRDRQTFFRSVVDDLDKDKRDILAALEELSDD